MDLAVSRALTAIQGKRDGDRNAQDAEFAEKNMERGRSGDWGDHVLSLPCFVFRG